MDVQKARKIFEGLETGKLVLLSDLVAPRKDRWLFGAYDSLCKLGSSYEKYVRFQKSSAETCAEIEPVLWELFLLGNGHFIEMKEARYTHVDLESFGKITYGETEILDLLAGDDRVACHRDTVRKIFKERSAS